MYIRRVHLETHINAMLALRALSCWQIRIGKSLQGDICVWKVRGKHPPSHSTKAARDLCHRMRCVRFTCAGRTMWEFVSCIYKDVAKMIYRPENTRALPNIYVVGNSPFSLSLHSSFLNLKCYSASGKRVFIYIFNPLIQTWKMLFGNMFFRRIKSLNSQLHVHDNTT